MKTELNSLQDAARYQLQGLYAMEMKMKQEFDACCAMISSASVQSEVKKYQELANSKLLKLERALSYLCVTPKEKESPIIKDMVAETHYLMDCTSSPHLRNVLMISCFQNINALKASAYRVAYMFLLVLELETAADLMQQVLDWELETQTALKAISITEFNKFNSRIEANDKQENPA